MNEMTESELVTIVGGDNALLEWSEQAAADGLSAMDGESELKSLMGGMLAVVAGWTYIGASIWDWLFD